MESVELPADAPYRSFRSLSFEAREKLTRASAGNAGAGRPDPRSLPERPPESVDRASEVAPPARIPVSRETPTLIRPSPSGQLDPPKAAHSRCFT